MIKNTPRTLIRAVTKAASNDVPIATSKSSNFTSEVTLNELPQGEDSREDKDTPRKSIRSWLSVAPRQPEPKAALPTVMEEEDIVERSATHQTDVGTEGTPRSSLKEPSSNRKRKKEEESSPSITHSNRKVSYESTTRGSPEFFRSANTPSYEKEQEGEKEEEVEEEDDINGNVDSLEFDPQSADDPFESGAELNDDENTHVDQMNLPQSPQSIKVSSDSMSAKSSASKKRKRSSLSKSLVGGGGNLDTKRQKRSSTSDMDFPPALTKKLFKSFCSRRVSKDAMESIIKGSTAFFSNVASDLQAYARHAKRGTVNFDDAHCLMLRQKIVKDSRSLTDVARLHLPREYCDEIVAMVKERECN